MTTARLECTSLAGPLTFNSTFRIPFCPRDMIDLPLLSIYPLSQITKSQLNLSPYFSRYLFKLGLPISSSPSIKNLILHGTSPVCFRMHSTAFILVISSPLSSDDPLP